MFIASSTRTMEGARRLAAARVELPTEEAATRTVYPRDRKAVRPARPITAISPRINAPAHARQIIEMVAAWRGTTASEIVGHSRFDEHLEARFDAIAAVYVNCRRRWTREDGSIAVQPYSVLEMGRIFGGRDHSTTLHALDRRGLTAAKRKSLAAGGGR